MFRPISAIKYIFACLILFGLSNAFCSEPEVSTSSKEIPSLKGIGLDKRVKVLGALFLIFAPIGAFAYNKNRQGSLNTESKIKIIEKRALDQNTSILLVEVSGTTLVLSKTTNGISLIKEISTTNIASSNNNISLVANES